MADDVNEQDVSGAFETVASEQTRADAREALNELLREYMKQSKVLTDTMKGDTRFSQAADDQRMAKIISAHLATLGFQIQVAALVCARLDGLDVEDMITEIKELVEENGAPAPRM